MFLTPQFMWMKATVNIYDMYVKQECMQIRAPILNSSCYWLCNDTFLNEWREKQIHTNTCSKRLIYSSDMVWVSKLVVPVFFLLCKGIILNNWLFATKILYNNEKSHCKGTMMKGDPDCLRGFSSSWHKQKIDDEHTVDHSRIPL